MGFCHSAVVLAARWGANMEAAAVVGVFHDFAKEISPAEIRLDLERRGCRIDPDDEPFAKTWHGQCAAVWAEQDYGIKNAAVLEAIRLHATADAGVSLLTRIAVVADMIEPTRHFKGVDELRELARTSINAAFIAALETKLGHLLEQKKPVHPRAMRALLAYSPMEKHPAQEETHGQD